MIKPFLMKDEAGIKIEEIFWPIAISIFLSNMIGFIDSAIIANYSTVSLNAINIANQIKSIFGPMYFGILSGLSIYTAQAIGKNNRQMLAKTFGFGLVFITVLAVVNFITVLLFSTQIINFFVDVNTDVGQEALKFLNITLVNTIFWPISMLFMYQFRSTKMPKVPMVINTLMLATNAGLNFLLIYGIGPFPELGITGAAIATVFSVGFYIIVYLIVAFKVKAKFLDKPSVMFKVEFSFVKQIITTTMPLIIIELLFGASRIFYNKMYIALGIESYTLVTVSTNITNLVNAGVIATANTAGIIMGEALGAGSDLEQIKKSLFSFMRRVAIFMFVVIAVVLPVLIPVYRPNDIEVDNFYILVYALMLINGIYMIIRVFSSTLISILKSGGDTKAVIFADPVSSYLIGIPLTAIGLYVFDLGIVSLKIIWITEIIGKLVISYYLYKQNKWMKKL